MALDRETREVAEHLMSGADLDELRAVAKDLRTLAPDSALAQLVEEKIERLQGKIDMLRRATTPYPPYPYSQAWAAYLSGPNKQAPPVAQAARGFSWLSTECSHSSLIAARHCAGAPEALRPTVQRQARDGPPHAPNDRASLRPWMVAAQPLQPRWTHQQ